eukprot:Gregarina_sp_Poly_1__10303@NODE_726_length_6582_cov_72_170837_g544_i0_p7_GENE_NODE_726_length_6582_cov_72_170837_g544_i0NODE_726_length_6582_cov_72_170837_g544_i0_p7_ORF_typecomplete_len105_score1_33_NODE_726_length_6582_cov_72_170837_g544_i014661780
MKPPGKCSIYTNWNIDPATRLYYMPQRLNFAESILNGLQTIDCEQASSPIPTTGPSSSTHASQTTASTSLSQTTSQEISTTSVTPESTTEVIEECCAVCQAVSA